VAKSQLAASQLALLTTFLPAFLLSGFIFPIEQMPIVVQWITRYWKISTHALGITAPLIALSAIFGSRPLPFLVLIPIVCWARVYLGAHTPAQVIAGVGLSAVSTYVMLRLFHII